MHLGPAAVPRTTAPAPRVSAPHAGTEAVPRCSPARALQRPPGVCPRLGVNSQAGGAEMGPKGPAQRHPTPPGRPAAGLRFLDFDSFLLSSCFSSMSY